MPRTRIDRRSLLAAGSAALAGTALCPPAFAKRKTAAGGFSKPGLDAIPPALQRFVDQGAAMGLVTLLYRHGEIAQVNALGWQDREAGKPMRRDTIFRIASMTKPVTCAAALTLIEDGKIALTDPVEKWIPELANPRVLNRPDGPLKATHPAPRGITVLDLLTHRSGLAYSFTAQGSLAAALAPMLEDTRAGTTTFDAWLKRLGALPLAYDPGSRWHYGYSHEVLGALIERASGQRFADYLKARIFDPLGMTDTGFWLPADKQGRLAVLYGSDAEGRRVPVSRPVPDAPPAFASGGGGLVSTAGDYLKFARMLLGRGRADDARILSRRSVALMTSNWLTPEQRRLPAFGAEFWTALGFGLGVSVVEDITKIGVMAYGSEGSFGWPGAYGTSWQADPAEDMISIYMVQNDLDLGPSADTERRRAQTAAYYAPFATFNALAYNALDD